MWSNEGQAKLAIAGSNLTGVDTVARGLAEAHGGRLWVENVEGGGALVCVTLPRVPDGQGDGTTAR